MATKRARSGCLTCRLRKTKCDEKAEECGNCQKMGIECIRSNNGKLMRSERIKLAKSNASSLYGVTQAGYARTRAVASCLGCRRAKTRCNGDRPICDRCAAKGIACEFSDFQFASDSSLAEQSIVRSLVDIFFQEIAPTRCFGFIHKPSFIQHLDDGLENGSERNALLYSICALATKSTITTDMWRTGCEWAKAAQMMIFKDLSSITIKALMCVILLHEHEARVGNTSVCFLLSGLAIRLSQALQLTHEHGTNILIASSKNATEKEICRRLMWACYLNDIAVASGLKQLQVLDEDDIKIQLPCDEHHFTFQEHCITDTLMPSAKTDKNHGDLRTEVEGLGYRAYYIRLCSIHTRIQRYVKKYKTLRAPWSKESEFACIITDLQRFKASLPTNLDLSPTTIYIRKEQGVLSTLLLIHATYYLCFCDLFRICVPCMMFPPTRANAISLAAPPDFISQHQLWWYDSACHLTELFRIALSHTPEAMSERLAAIAAHEATRIQLTYVTEVVGEIRREALRLAILEMVQINLSYLQVMQRLHPTVESLYASAETFIKNSRLFTNVNSATQEPENSNPSQNESDKNPLTYNLHPFSLFRQLISAVSEKDLGKQPQKAPETGELNVTSVLGSEFAIPESWLPECTTQAQQDVLWPWTGYIGAPPNSGPEMDEEFSYLSPFYS